MQDILKKLNGIANNVFNDMSKEQKYETLTEELVRNGEIPLILYKGYIGKNIKYNPIISKYIRYIKAYSFKTTSIINGKKKTVYRNTHMEIMGKQRYFKSKRHHDIMKLSDKETVNKILEIETKIHELNQEKQEFLKQKWGKLKRLTQHKASEYHTIKKEIRKKLDLEEY